MLQDQHDNLVWEEAPRTDRAASIATREEILVAQGLES